MVSKRPLVSRLSAFLGALLLVAGALSPARAVEPGDLTLTVTPELNGNTAPFSREMVLLKIHGVYKQPILLEEVVQPTLANFSWTQLGRDTWSKTKLPDGQSAIAFDRVIAVFPHHPGDFVIDPFIHRLTINDVGERKVVDVRSGPIPLPVAAWTQPTGGPDAKDPWWLPARDVTITDSWIPDPETVKIGETTRRIVTIEAQGMVAEGLPPRPVMRTRGILTFAGPVTRETIITPQGPIAKATYQWDVRPAIDDIIPLDAIAIPWFDTRLAPDARGRDPGPPDRRRPARPGGGAAAGRDRARRDRGRGPRRLRARPRPDRLRLGPAPPAPRRGPSPRPGARRRRRRRGGFPRALAAAAQARAGARPTLAGAARPRRRPRRPRTRPLRPGRCRAPPDLARLARALSRPETERGARAAGGREDRLAPLDGPARPG